MCEGGRRGQCPLLSCSLIKPSPRLPLVPTILAGASTQTVTPAGATTTALAAVTQPNLTPVRPWERQSATATGLANTSYGSSYTGGPMYSRFVDAHV